jgi:hypothetical protein
MSVRVGLRMLGAQRGICKTIIMTTLVLTTLMVEQILSWLCIGFFFASRLGKRDFANLYYKGFLIIFGIKNLQY